MVAGLKAWEQSDLKDYGKDQKKIWSGDKDIFSLFNEFKLPVQHQGEESHSLVGWSLKRARSHQQ